MNIAIFLLKNTGSKDISTCRVVFCIPFYERVHLMQEILTAVTYLVAWLACEKVFHIESGLVKLLVSLGAAVGVYVLIAVKERREKRKKGEDD